MTHDKLAVRLAQILMRFNNGGRFSLEELASEFNVDIRTIQRDLNQRL
ncbi:TPA: HTH domain-containing protein, partial [Campylobacter jejuni]|nr:HTH domain-containing protein [Campylobacter jejuni]